MRLQPSVDDFAVVLTRRAALLVRGGRVSTRVGALIEEVLVQGKCMQPGRRWRAHLSLLAVIMLFGCGDKDERFPTAMSDRFDCEGFVVPQRVEPPACDDVDGARPQQLVRCQRGSGHLGQWTIDDAGLPAYDFLVEQRCDPAAHAYSPRPTPLRDPIHLIGNGRGLVAMAHASGGVEIYTQDRGHKWINRIDTWHDPANSDYPPQLGGGFNYYVVDSDGAAPKIGSTRFEDLPVNRATAMQTRRFGVGYHETVTRDVGIVVQRRVFAPDTDARALVAEVSLHNPTQRRQHYQLIEFWDVNISQVKLELLTSDVGTPGVSAEIDARRRALAAEFTHSVSWSAEQRVAVVETQAKNRPAQIHGRLDVSNVDYFPDPIFLAVLDDGVVPDAVWLSAAELWPAQKDTAPPPSIAGEGDGASRSLALDGAGQPAVLALRVAVDVEAGASVTRRFAFGYVPGGDSPAAAVAELRAHSATLRDEAENGWRERLVWAAFPGLPDAAVMQRELAWASYNAVANTTFDEYRNVRLLGQGGAYKYIHGLDGAMGDLALFAEAVSLIDPGIAADTLAYALATQTGPSQGTRFRFPYATTGVGAYSDVGIYNLRSDAYYFLPAAIARYVALSRDAAFLQRQVSYWPRSRGDVGSVVDHMRGAIQFGTETLGFGARGIVAIGTGDYADGITALATEAATPKGSSSTYNAGAIIYGLPLAADIVEDVDAAFAQRLRDLVATQATALLERAWEGRYFYRGFVDSGNPLAPHIFFLEPQLFPVLAGIIDDTRRDLALDEVIARLETDIGALSNVAIGSAGEVGGPDQPLIGGIWPVANAWLTGALARRDASAGWSSFTRNTLAAHAEKYPDLWYGIWTGPDSFNGPDHERPGEADAHLVTALTDYPALNVHVHTGPLRALMEIVGVAGTRDGLRITPRLPTEIFSVAWPRLQIRSTPQSIEGTFIATASGPVVFEVALPSQLRDRPLRVVVDGQSVDADVQAGLVRFTAPVRAEISVAWAVDAAS